MTVLLIDCAPVGAWLSLIDGKIIIEQGEILGLDLDSLTQQHNQQAQRLLRQAAARGNYHD